jgi:hypothetical protein
MLPPISSENLCVQLGFPQYLKRLSLRIIIETGEANESGIALRWWRDDLFDEILSLTDASYLSG